MSWDVVALTGKVPPPPAAEMTDDWRNEPLGTSAEVRQKISECLPEVNWTDPAHGRFEGDGFSLGFSLPEQDISESIGVQVRGEGDAVATLIRLAERWNWYLYDCSQGEWLHHCSDVNAGWKGFQEFRNRVLQQNVTEDEI